MTLSLRIDGMTCAACTARVERVLGKAEGVTSVNANLMTGSVTVDGTANPEVLAASVGKAGFTAREAVTRLAIRGMTCATCVSRVERVLQALPGVREASVNLAAESAQVRHLDLDGFGGTLAETVRGAGYEARVLTDESRNQRAEDRVRDEQALRRAVLLAALLTLPVFVVEMGGHLIPAFHHWVMGTFDRQALLWMQFVLTSLVLFGPGLRFFRAGVPALAHGSPDMNSLVVLGAGAAWGYSTVVTVAPNILPESGQLVFFEAAAVIVTLILFGRLLEARAKGRTGAAVARLIGLQPRTARVERNGHVVEIEIGDVAVGDVVHLRPGERVAVDGTVLSGVSHVDESMITGEPMPVAKVPGSVLTGGTVNGTGAMTFRAMRVGADTVLAGIIRMVEEAQGGKLPIQAVVDRVTRVFVPVVMGVALVTGLVWFWIGPEPQLAHALIAAVSVLIIACPCAMGLATPTSIMVGTGRAAEMGVLFRRGDALQALQSVGVVAFDKTGTLTEGRPVLASIATQEGWTEDEALLLASALETGSEHPVAHAILAAAGDQPLPAVEDVRADPGFGLSGTSGGRRIVIGALRLLEREGIAPGTLAELPDVPGQTPLFMAVDGVAVARFLVADTVKSGARAVISALHAQGVKVAMITGDTEGAARAIAADLGIDEVFAGVLPGGKLRTIEALQAGGVRVAFVGDGINDAPALAAADVGIAVGSGTDVAIESAEVVLVSGDISGVVNAIDISRKVLRNIKQNLFWAFAYNAALIPVAAGVVYPGFGITLSPMLGAAAMALSSIFVLTNALRLRGLRPVISLAGAPA